MKLTVLLGVAGAEGNGLAWTLWVDSEEDDDSLNQSSSPHHHHWPTILMIFIAHLGLGGGGSRKTPGCPDKPTSIFNGCKRVNWYVDGTVLHVYIHFVISGLLSVLSYLSHLLNCTFSLDELIRNADLGSVIFWLWTLVDGWQQKSHFHPTKSPKDFN